MVYQQHLKKLSTTVHCQSAAVAMTILILMRLAQESAECIGESRIGKCSVFHCWEICFFDSKLNDELNSCNNEKKTFCPDALDLPMRLKDHSAKRSYRLKPLPISITYCRTASNTIRTCNRLKNSIESDNKTFYLNYVGRVYYWSWNNYHVSVTEDYLRNK